MRWIVHGERTLYDSPWVRLALTDVEIPDTARFEHHVVRAPRPAAGVVVRDAVRGALLLWRHRFTTDTWGWEIPAGRVDEGETPDAAGAPEALEETGWEPGPLRPLLAYFPNNGQSDLCFHLFVADGARHVGDPSDPSESERVEWVPWDAVRAAIASGEVRDGMSVTGLALVLAGLG